jgi:neurofibromin 1
MSIEIPVSDLSSSPKSTEVSSSVALACSVLQFLDAHPMSLFDSVIASLESGPSLPADMFESFLSCVISPDDTIRRLAGNIARRLFIEPEFLEALRTRGSLKTTSFGQEFWRQR